MPKPEGAFPDLSLPHSTIRPIGVYALSGLASDGKFLLAVDTIRGYLVAIDRHTNIQLSSMLTTFQTGLV